MAQFFNQLSKSLYEVTQELLDLFAINTDSKTTLEASNISDSDD